MYIREFCTYFLPLNGWCYVGDILLVLVVIKWILLLSICGLLRWIHTGENVRARTTARITAEPPPNHRGTTAEPVAWKSSAVVLGKNGRVYSFRGRPPNFSTRLVPRWFRGGSAVIPAVVRAGTISSVWIQLNSLELQRPISATAVGWSFIDGFTRRM